MNIADFLMVPGAGSGPPPVADQLNAKAELAAKASVLDAALQEIQDAVYSDAMQCCEAGETALKNFCVDCTMELAGHVKSLSDALGPIYQKIGADFFGDYNYVLKLATDAGMVEPVAEPLPVDLPGPVMESPVVLPVDLPQPITDTTLPADPVPPPVDAPPTVESCSGGRLTDPDGRMPDPSRYRSTGGTTYGGGVGTQFGRIEMYGLSGGFDYQLVNGGESGLYSFKVLQCDGAEAMVWAQWSNTTCTAQIINVFSSTNFPDTCGAAAPPPAPPPPPDACGTGPVCPPGVTQEAIRAAVEAINAAHTDAATIKAMRDALKLLGIKADDSGASSPYDCPSEPTCPVPGEPAPTPTGPPARRPTAFQPPEWCKLDVCESLKSPPPATVEPDVTQQTDADGNYTGVDIPTPDEPLTPVGGAATAGVNVTGGAAGNPPGWIGGVVNGLLGTMGELVASALTGVGLEECNAAYVGQFAASLAEKYTGVDFSPVYQPLRYWANWCNPTLIPSQPSLDALRLGDAITEEQWKCLTRANGNCESWAGKVYETGRSRASILDLWRQLQYGDLKDSEYTDETRKLGIIDDGDRKRIERSFAYIPGPSDIVRFVMKDVADPEAIAAYKLDEGYEASYQGRLEKWGKANGLDSETMKFYYRSAWTLISPTQSAEMLHRLRPGRDPSGEVWTEKDAERLLKFADYPEPLRKKLLAISYNTVTRTDGERMFFGGQIDSREYREMLRDDGYNQRDADRLGDFYDKEKRRTLRSRLGVYSPANALQWYVKGYVDADLLAARLEMETDDGEALAEAMAMADTEKAVSEMAEEVSMIRSQYIGGCFDASEAILQLRVLGCPVWSVERWVDQWTRAKHCQAKNITASDLCKMRERGIITAEEQITRLTRIGFEQDAALRIAGLCESDISERAMKRIEQAIKAAQKQAEKDAKAKAKADKEAARRAKCGPDEIKCPAKPKPPKGEPATVPSA